jgi:eukaryotic-like serine/threonine-protein kinase
MDATVTDPLVGQLLSDRYRIRRRIAHGGMATVYQAIDTRLERVVAIKMIHPRYAGNPQFLARFDREAKTVARLTHPNVVSVFDSGTHGGLPYLVMEYVAGRTLRDVLTERGRLSPAEALSVAEPMLAALGAAHRAGLVHRDVKPENILISSPDGNPTQMTVKVADFGLARAVEQGTDEATGGQLMATVAYVPPELVRTGRADERSDVYSAGIVLYEMLTGSVPYQGRDALEVAYQHVERDVPAPSTLTPGLPPAVDDLVLRATRRDPAARPAHADAFLAELRTVRQHTPLSTTAGPAPRTVAHHTVVMKPDPRHFEPGYEEAPRSRRGLLIGLAVVAVLAMVAAVGGWWLGAGRYTSAPSLLTVSKATAVQRARHYGFHVQFAPRQFSETAPKNTVLSQDPQPGGRITRHGTITVVLSKGPERYTIPQLAGENQSAAYEKLKNMHLAVTTVQQYSDNVAQGHVVTVHPKPGTVVRRNAEVRLVVSKGVAPVKVPDVRGEDSDSAQSELSGAGLQVTVKQKQSTSVQQGDVISQSIAPDTGVALDTHITITVSSGPPQVSVPDVTGMKYSQAKNTLQKAGFQVRGIGVVRGNGTVRSQDPGGGSTAPEGSTVTLWVF